MLKKDSSPVPLGPASLEIMQEQWLVLKNETTSFALLTFILSIGLRFFSPFKMLFLKQSVLK